MNRLIVVLLALACAAEAKKPKQEVPQLSPLQQYVEAARARGAEGKAAPGSLFATNGMFSDLGRDLRASRIDDLVTIVVADRASAVSKGATSSGRNSSARASVTSFAGPMKTLGPLTDLLGANSDQKLDGQGETSRTNELNTTLSARVVEVMPNGNLVIEGTKDVQVNSERQRVVVRGIARWNDLNAANQVRSERLAQLEVWIDGKGVVNDAIRRPNFLYRLILGILPF